jgi:hypothetical protein
MTGRGVAKATSSQMIKIERAALFLQKVFRDALSSSFPVKGRDYVGRPWGAADFSPRTASQVN